MKTTLPAVLIAVVMATATTTASASYCPSGNNYKKHADHYYPHHYRYYRDMHSYYPRYPRPSWHAGKPAYNQPTEQQPASDAAASAPTQASANIIDTATSAGSFNTLLDALDTAGLVETLQGIGPFTVFAPNDQAFAKIPETIRTAIIADKEALTELLTYHVIAGEVTAADVASLTSAETVQGSTITIDTSDGVKVDGARVVTTDIRASNGIIHVIDTVMIPN